MTKEEIALKMALAYAQIEYAERLKKDKIEQSGFIPLNTFYDLVKHNYDFFYSFCDLDISTWGTDYETYI